MEQQDAAHLLSGVVEFDDAYFGFSTVGSKWGQGMEKATDFVVVLSLDGHGNPQYLKMGMTTNNPAGLNEKVFRLCCCGQQHYPQ